MFILSNGEITDNIVSFIRCGNIELILQMVNMLPDIDIGYTSVKFQKLG